MMRVAALLFAVAWSSHDRAAQPEPEPEPTGPRQTISARVRTGDTWTSFEVTGKPLDAVAMCKALVDHLQQAQRGGASEVARWCRVEPLPPHNLHQPGYVLELSRPIDEANLRALGISLSHAGLTITTESFTLFGLESECEEARTFDRDTFGDAGVAVEVPPCRPN